MYISCPNCATRYNLTPTQLGPSGKSVRCSNCGNTWHQMPVADPPPPATPQGRPQAAQGFGGYPQQPQGYQGFPGFPGYPPPGAYPGYPPPGAYPGYPPNQAEASVPHPEPEPAPAPEPEPKSRPEPDIPDLPDDDEGEHAGLPPMDDDMDAAMDDLDLDDDDEGEKEEDSPLSQDDLDAMFDNDDDDDASVSSIVDDDDKNEDIELDDLEEPEPIPEVFTADETGDDYDEDEDDDEYEDEEETSSKLKYIIAAVAVLLVLGIGGGLFVFKDSIPGLNSIVEAIGFEDDSLGAGLDIRDVKSTRESISGIDVLVVRGVVANVSDRVRPVPQLELRLSDLDGNVVQTGQADPLRPELAAGEDISFRVQVDRPSSLARRLEVTFIERADPAAQ